MLRKRSSKQAIELLSRHEGLIAQECQRQINQMNAVSQEMGTGWEKQVQEISRFVIDVCKGRNALQKGIAQLEKRLPQEKETYEGLQLQISSLFLKECWQYLASDPGQNERLHLVTGTITPDGIRVLSRMEQVSYAKQSSAYVSADINDANQKIISLSEQYGHLVLGMFHSHISKGLEATMPSGIDSAFMNRMAQVGIHCLGGIFSLDGYVRFFTHEKDFEVEIYGKGIKQCKAAPEYKIFRIEQGDKQ